MLVLTRKASQSITIGDDITVTIVEVRGGKVRIGIDAPRDVEILRDDAHDREPSSERRARSEDGSRRRHHSDPADDPVPQLTGLAPEPHTYD